MKTLSDYLDEYELSHQNPVNKRLHWLCVPLIMQSLVGMGTRFSLWLTLVAMLLALVYYARLSPRLMVGMGIFLAILLATALALPLSFGGFLALFALAWVGQFYGHKKEGKKPSFFTDLQFLLIGPAWCMQHLTRQLKTRRTT